MTNSNDEAMNEALKDLKAFGFLEKDAPKTKGKWDFKNGDLAYAVPACRRDLETKAFVYGEVPICSDCSSSSAQFKSKVGVLNLNDTVMILDVGEGKDYVRVNSKHGSGWIFRYFLRDTRQ